MGKLQFGKWFWTGLKLMVVLILVSIIGGLAYAIFLIPSVVISNSTVATILGGVGAILYLLLVVYLSGRFVGKTFKKFIF